MDLSLGTLIGQAGTFLVLVLVTMKYVWPPLTEAMEQRRQKIAEGLAQSDKAEKRLEKAEAEAEQIIRDARARSGEIIDQASKRGNEIVEQAKQEAIAERDRQVSAAEADIKLAVNQARETLRERMAELTIAGAERVIEQELDADRHRKLLDKLAAEL
ncbi:MAG: F0F1 ATP synthase subunit B [Wenzhouxiangellaceae bacterium]|jgi:F-type H+-transporting ATPase subunit b|nr:F0F1 ATP synthase subunit B [Wenzhouxiangellaceae bacterium]MBS3746255.1 F0F1 ATP synthase subunit B [Wenzhouxiangellaceae bacterium]MBS3824190.1 F0F1 ATP synthase subunit B [Wenzhouxiangellaceae bacterium]